MELIEISKLVTTGYNFAVVGGLLSSLFMWYVSLYTMNSNSRTISAAKEEGRLFKGFSLFVLAIIIWRVFWAVALLDSGSAQYAPWSGELKGFLLLPISIGLAGLWWAWHPFIVGKYGKYWWTIPTIVSICAFAIGIHKAL